jgi:hypothetical protein
LNLFFIHIQYGNHFENDSLKRLYKYFNFVNNFEHIKCVIVENNTDCDLEIKNPYFDSIYKIYGSNNYYDFSAFEEGLKYFHDNYFINDNDIFIFSNDTFFRHRYFDGVFKYQFQKKLFLSSNLNRPFIIGYIDKNLDKNCFIDNTKFTKHISTFLFIINKMSLNRIKILSKDKFNTKISFRNNILFLNDIQDDYSKKIENWLFKPSKIAWYRAQKIDNVLLNNKKLYEFYLLKLFCVLNEHNLFIQSLNSDIEIISLFKQNKFDFINIYNSLESRLIIILKKLGYYKFLK